MKITLAQLNPVVGDITGNNQKLFESVEKAQADRPDLVIFPELYLCGYQPRDLLERSWFIEAVERAIVEITAFSKRFPATGILFGAPTFSRLPLGRGLYNSAVLICHGETVALRHKTLLPTYDVFDETRHFDPAQDNAPVTFKGERLGITICEDAWNDDELWPKRRYDRDPVGELAEQGATLLLNLSASPFFVGKEEIRFRLVSNHARKHRLPMVFVNQVGGNDEIIYDGRSFAVDSTGLPVAVLPAFAEKAVTVDTASKGRDENYEPQEKIESVFEALVLGVKDYLHKCGFRKAVVGLSGGIDSAVTACIAAVALGKENVLGVTLPGPFSSEGSFRDSERLAQTLGINFKIISIKEIYQTYLSTVKSQLQETRDDITEQNLQARIRGNILMAFSNEYGYLLLSTGNKSELAVGYCTLYGDMSGGLAVIADVPKTMIYELAAYINREKEIIPPAVIRKAPSAELRPNQTDQDTLPPYDVLDRVLHYYLNENYSYSQLLSLGVPQETVQWIVKTVDRNEYKRRQAIPGLKVTSKAFGIGRRMPIAAKYPSF